MQSKVIEYTKTYETIKSHDKKPSMKANDKVTYVLELSGKDFQVTMEKCFNKQLQVCLKQTNKQKIERLSKEITDIKKNQMENF